jgi:hypothetical protein
MVPTRLSSPKSWHEVPGTVGKRNRAGGYGVMICLLYTTLGQNGTVVVFALPTHFVPGYFRSIP